MNWEDCYQEAQTPWDLGEAAPPLVDLLSSRPVEIWGDGPVLVPGSGRGHDAAALQRSGREVLALDLAPTALTEAQRLYGTPERLTWMEGDFLALDPASVGWQPMGAIFEHTCFCAIDPEQRPAYVEAARRWLRPEGRLVAIFFLDPPVREDGEPGPPFGASREEIRNLFEPGFRIQREAVPDTSHPGREGREWVVEFIKRL